MVTLDVKKSRRVGVSAREEGKVKRVRLGSGETKKLEEAFGRQEGNRDLCSLRTA